MNSAASATRSQTESKNAPRGPARPLWRATEPSRMSGRPVRIDAEDPEQEVAVGDQQRGADGEDEPDDGQAVGGDPGPVQALADGLESPLDCRAPASVEHAQKVLGRRTVQVERAPQGNTRSRPRRPGRRAPGRHANRTRA